MRAGLTDGKKGFICKSNRDAAEVSFFEDFLSKAVGYDFQSLCRRKSCFCTQDTASDSKSRNLAATRYTWDQPLGSYILSHSEAWIIFVFPLAAQEVLGEAAFAEPVHHTVLSLTQKKR